MNFKSIAGIVSLAVMGMQMAHAAIALDRTRAIFNGGEKSISLSISNENKKLPYLVQAWLEDTDGKKINSPLTLLPPLQRVEPGAKSQVKVQSLPAVGQLPQDRESIFYFNLREIPPRSDQPNVLQIALQSRIKLFYRPKAIVVSDEAGATPWQDKVILIREGERIKLNNPTPYYVTFVDAGPNQKTTVKKFEPIMLAPFSSGYANVSAAELGSAPVLTYINDYGGYPKLVFSCSGATCNGKTIKNG